MCRPVRGFKMDRFGLGDFLRMQDRFGMISN